MKRVLITGKNSYVGNNLEKWLAKFPEDYIVDKISLRNNEWKSVDFSVYDTIVHVAGIAHRKETNKNAYLYYEVNRDLTYQIAYKAKVSKVPHFIFLSTMSVFGLEQGIINKNTPLKPKTHYGVSKFQAEKLLYNLKDNDFKVSIIRPPMIYGKDCPGNYQRLRWLALKTPIFPKVNNQRSMIFIDNLSYFLKHIIDCALEGFYHPQNNEYINTSVLVEQIAIQNNKKVFLISSLNPLMKILNFSLMRKVFGTLVYDNRELINMPISFIESIKKAEGRTS